MCHSSEMAGRFEVTMDKFHLEECLNAILINKKRMNEYNPPPYYFEASSPPAYGEVCTWEVVDAVEVSKNLFTSGKFPEGRHPRKRRNSGESHKVVDYRGAKSGGRKNKNTSKLHGRTSNHSQENETRGSQRISAETQDSQRMSSLPISTKTDKRVSFKLPQFWDVFYEHKNQRCFRKVSKAGIKNKYLIRSVEAKTILKYEIETTLEARSTKAEEEPHYPSTFVDNEETSVCSEWGLKIKVPKDCHPVQVKIPGSSSVSSCSSCAGDGSIPCGKCHGDGHHHCHECGGTGRHYSSEIHSEFNHSTHHMETKHRSHSETCHDCHGATYVRCHYCYGEKKRTCSRCNGTGELEWSCHVVAKWKKFKDQFFIGDPEIPKKVSNQFLSGCTGKILFDDMTEYGEPLLTITEDICSEPELREYSDSAVADHFARSRGNVIRKQRHFITKIPIYLVKYKSRSDTLKSVWVVGTNYKILKRSEENSRGWK